MTLLIAEQSLTDKKIGILLSGGIDSAVLLYLLAADNPNIDIQPFVINKSDGAVLYVDDIIKWVADKTDCNIKPAIVVGDPTAHHSLMNRSAIADVLNNHQEIEHIYIAINKVPPALKDLPSTPQRATHSANTKVVLPFVDYTKDVIIRVARDRGILDLLKLTHSCTEQRIGRCDQCWQCTERKWAFKQLDIRDPGDI
jgi:hypothetical protein